MKTTHQESTRNRCGAGLIRHLPSDHILFFLLVWIFFGLYYGDVMYIARENSYFTTDMEVMRPLWTHAYGSLWIIGRALLQAFRYPWLGGLLTAAMLTVISWLFGYVCKLRGRFNYLKYIPAGVYLFIVVYKGFDMYYRAETGMVLGIPFCILFILAIQAVFVRSFSKKPMPGLFRNPEGESPKGRMASYLTVVAVMAVCFLYSALAMPYMRPTARMQRLMERQDWKGMQAVAENCDMSYTTIAAYYAISRMEDHEDVSLVPLMELPKNGPHIMLHDRNGVTDNAMNYCLLDYTFASGLYDQAYEQAKAALNADGPSLHLLKVLTLVCNVKDLTEERDAYLRLLQKAPFETIPSRQ